jgi:HEAT repeat protein
MQIAWFTILAGLILYLCLSVGIRLGAQAVKPRAQLIGRRVLLAGMLIGIAAAFWPREPSYKGRALSDWLALLDDGEYDMRQMLFGRPTASTEDQLQAQEAIRHMGAEALPDLLVMLQTKDPELQVRNQNAKDLRERLVQFWTSLWRHHYTGLLAAARVRHRASLGIAALGSSARPAIPQLVTDFKDDVLSKDAAFALASLGPEGLPPLRKAISSRAGTSQGFAAMWAVGRFPEQGQAALPEIAQCLTDGRSIVRFESALTLTEIQTDPDAATRALTNNLTDPDSQVRSVCHAAIRHYGTRATSAVPVLLKVLAGPNPTSEFTDTLKAIDPNSISESGLQ